ncbi:hypothetical protein N7527_000105 [Penicillium freii]|nr:hypothetical protein N7527_000105 [Penicillium freii]
MTMRVKDLSEVLEARVKLVVSRGFTIDTISSNLKVLRRRLYYYIDKVALLKNIRKLDKTVKDDVIVYGIVDNIFKNISSIKKLLAEDKKDLPFFRIVTPEGPLKDKVLTFVLLRYNNISLARRDSFKDLLYIYRRASKATCS